MSNFEGHLHMFPKKMYSLGGELSTTERNCKQAIRSLQMDYSSPYFLTLTVFNGNELQDPESVFVGEDSPFIKQYGPV